MRKFLSILLLLAPMSAFASNPARFDLPVVTTTPAQVPVGSLPDLLAVTNATIAVCSYPATLSNGMCTNTITTYSDSTLSSACPSTAQLTANGTSVCISTTGLQGAFGFWYDAAVNTHMTYTVQTSWGTFGPYDILPGSSSGGPGTVTNFSAGNAAPLFTTSVSNSTSTPALSFTPSPFAAHSFYGNNGASTGTPAASLLGVSDWSPNAYVVGSGSAQAQTVTLTPAATTLTAGLEVRWLPVAANTAAGPTLNVNGLGPRSITKFGANDLAPGDLTTQAVAYAIYDGSRFQLQNPQTATTAATLPSGTTNQMLYYAASGTTVTPLTLGTNLSITGGALNATGGSSLPTSNAIGDTLFATAPASGTYVARTTTKIPVELYGATAYATPGAAEAGPDDTANFQAAVTGSVGGVATCQAAKWYHVEGTVNFASNEGLVGTSNQSGSSQCQIVSNSATATILSAVGVSGTPLTGVIWANLHVTRSVIGTGTSTGLYASFTNGIVVTNVSSFNSIRDYYRHASTTAGTGQWSYDTAGWSLAETTGTYYAFYDDSADGNAENSITLVHAIVNCSNLSGSAVGYGQILTGEAINDNDTWDFNTTGCSYGQVVNYTGSGGEFAANDIHFYGSTLDGIGISCFKISNTSLATDGYVEVNGGHCNSSTSSSQLVDIESSFGVKVDGLNINQHDGFGAIHAILAASSSNLVLANNTITNFGTTNANNTPIELTGTTHSALTGNVIYGYTSNAGNIIWLTGNSTNNSITGNSISGYSSVGAGIGIDAGSSGNIYASNSFDTTHIPSGNTILDAGGGSQLSPENGLYQFTQLAAAAHVASIIQYAPNAIFGSGTCFVYDRLGVKNATNDYLDSRFGCNGDGSTANWYGWEFGGAATYNAQMFPNLSFEFGETAPAAGPANGIAVGSSGNAQIDGSGNISTAAVTAATSSTAVNSPFAKWIGNYWNGSVSALDTWTCNVQFNTSGSFTNPESDFTCNGSGSSGIHVFKSANFSGNLSGAVINAFSTAGAAAMGVFPSVNATSGVNQNSPFLSVAGDYWDGSLGRTDTYVWQDVIGTGTNPATAFTLIHTGSTGGSTGPTSLDLTAAANTKVTALNGLTTPTASGASIVSQKVQNGTAAMGTSAIASGACATVVTVAATGIVTTDVIQVGFNGDPTAVTGYVPGAQLTIIPYPTAGNVNFKLCNNTASSITPSALTINWRVAR